MNDYKHLVKQSILDEETFLKAVFSGQQRGHVIPWNKVVVRPVLIKERRHLQFSYFDAKKDITKNYTDAEIVEKLDELLALPFKSINVQTTNQTFQVQITKKGKVIIHQHKTPEQQKTPSLQHDRQKDLLLPADTPDPFLQQIGIMTQDGKVRAKMQKKFRQINEFLKLIVETEELEKIEQSPLNIIDCGCGNAYLTFAVYHYLNHMLGLPARMIGIDVNQSLLNRRLALSQDLGWDDLTFQATRIVDYRPSDPPGMVLALHACDTATDEALAQAVKWQSKMIFCAPCCHHHLQQQLTQQTAPSPFKPVLRHAIFKERWGDILTDSFRSLLLQIMGYRTEVVEFVSTEHTGKNLMIRAIKSGQPGNRQAIQEYKQLAEFWQVKPY
ncbi:SAM-dependent methyltransferase, partial [Chloroflexota bacterium]